MAAISEAAVPTPTVDNQQTEPANKKQNKGFLKRVFNKAADMAGRAAITGALKIAAVTTLAGIGASGFVTIGAAALASGLGAAFYVYAKDTFADWRIARRDGRDISWWNKERSRKMRIALLTGAAGGAFGAWLAGTDAFKAVLDVAKETAGKLLYMAIEGAHAAPAISVPVAPAIHEAVVAPATIAPISPADIHAAAPASTPNVLGRLWGMAMKSDQAHGKMMATLLKADPDNLNSVSPQFLKDRAHDVLRLKDVPWKDRLALAHDLAEAAKERGNKQAAQFLKDLVKLEHGATPHFGTAVHHVTAPLTHEAAHVVPDAAPAPVVAAPLVEAPPVQPALQFSEAATCRLAANATGSTGVDCTVNKASMQAGDYIGFVAAENPAVKVTTLLADGSTAVPTQSFLHERIIADGVARLDQVRATLKRTVPTP